MLKKACGKSTL